MTSSVQFACHLLDIFVQDISNIARGWDSGFQVTGDNQKSFLSLKCSIPGFFWWENLV